MKKINYIFSKRFKLCKTKGRLTWSQMSDMLGITESGLLNYAKGRIPNAETLTLISDIFGVSVDWLLGQTDKIDKPDAQIPEPEEISVDEAIDRAVIAIIGNDISDEILDEMCTKIKTKIYEERDNLRQQQLLERIAESARAAPESKGEVGGVKAG